MSGYIKIVWASGAVSIVSERMARAYSDDKHMAKQIVSAKWMM